MRNDQTGDEELIVEASLYKAIAAENGILPIILAWEMPLNYSSIDAVSVRRIDRSTSHKPAKIPTTPPTAHPPMAVMRSESWATTCGIKSIYAPSEAKCLYTPACTK